MRLKGFSSMLNSRDLWSRFSSSGSRRSQEEAMIVDGDVSLATARGNWSLQLESGSVKVSGQVGSFKLPANIKTSCSQDRLEVDGRRTLVKTAHSVGFSATARQLPKYLGTCGHDTVPRTDPWATATT